LLNKRIFDNNIQGEFEVDSLLVNNHQRLKEKLEGIVKQIEQYKAKKVAIANDIKNWTKVFQDSY
jgi:ribosomal protein L7Ae-like RNA K-turn-binding protein